MLFEVFKPLVYRPETNKDQLTELIKNMEKLMNNSFKEKLDLPKIFDPV